MSLLLAEVIESRSTKQYKEREQTIIARIIPIIHQSIKIYSNKHGFPLDVNDFLYTKCDSNGGVQCKMAS